jgi:hypothetical protein
MNMLYEMVALLGIAVAAMGCTSSKSPSSANQNAPEVAPPDAAPQSCSTDGDCPGGQVCLYPLGCDAKATCRESQFPYGAGLDPGCEYCRCPVGSSERSWNDQGWFVHDGEILFQHPSWECARCTPDASAYEDAQVPDGGH